VANWIFVVPACGKISEKTPTLLLNTTGTGKRSGRMEGAQLEPDTAEIGTKIRK